MTGLSNWCSTLASLALILVGAAQPARAERLSTRLDARSIASERSQPRAEWQQWGGPRKGGGDMVVSDTNTRGPLSLIVIGTGVVAGGAGVFFGLRNRSAVSDYHAAQTAAVRADARNRAQSAATIANVSWIASGVLLAAGLGMLFFTDI